MENTRNKPARRRLPLAVYLAFLLIAALAFTGASAASYKTETSVSDSARVARFVVTAKSADGQSEALTLDSTHTSAEYKFTVSNTDASGANINETAASYDVVVTFPQELTGVTLTLKNGNKDIDGTTTDNVTYTFKNVGTFVAGTEQMHTLTLTFTAGTNAASSSWSNINITVNAVQVD